MQRNTLKDNLYSPKCTELHGNASKCNAMQSSLISKCTEVQPKMNGSSQKYAEMQWNAFAQNTEMLQNVQKCSQRLPNTSKPTEIWRNTVATNTELHWNAPKSYRNTPNVSKCSQTIEINRNAPKFTEICRNAVAIHIPNCIDLHLKTTEINRNVQKCIEMQLSLCQNSPECSLTRTKICRIHRNVTNCTKMQFLQMPKYTEMYWNPTKDYWNVTKRSKL